MKAPNVKAGDKIKVYEYRNGKMVPATVTSDPVFEDTTACWEVDITFKNGNEHWALWHNGQWESGEN